ncbi:hypothetical protein [Reyranella sp.]|uniref:hypothetical protein n=1 Tax=Reyranella sp. TaxID=1929291 RepID=UPI003D1421EE
MSIIMVDGIKDIVFHNGIVRIDCLSAGPNGEQRASGTIVIPGNVTGPILQSLANAMQELDKKMRDHAAAVAAKQQGGTAN